MNQSDLQVASFFIGVVCLLLAWAIGVRKNEELLKSEPDAKPFVWGYTFHMRFSGVRCH